MNKQILACVVLLSTPACGSGPDVVARAGPIGGGDARGTSDTTTVPAPAISLTGVATAAAGATLADVQVCARIADASSDAVGDCTSSGPGGAWTLSAVPANEQIALTFEKPGFASMLRAIGTEAGDIVVPADGGLVPDSESASIMGGGVDRTRAQIAFVANGARDVTVSAVALDGKEAPAMRVASSRLEVNADGATAGAFTNVSSGFFVLTFHSAVAVCAPRSDLSGFPMEYQAVGDTHILVPTMDGYITAPVVVDCTASAAQ